MIQQAFIFLNGVYADQEPQVALVRPDSLVIGVDGGTRYLSSTNLTPQLVIGDMDSLPVADFVRLEASGIQVQRHPPEKDETDFELALDHAIQQGCNQILVFGALGGRTDQMMANILLPLIYLDKAHIILIRGLEELTYIKSREVIHGSPGDTLSLLPLAGDVTGIRTTGLRYPLESETLFFGKSRGISNELTNPEATITVSSGILLSIHASGSSVTTNSLEIK
jgi:thiamine pyrophosphokinase